MKETIHFIITGRTIDSYYDALVDTARPNKTSVIPEFIKNLKLYDDTEFTTICMKDSREINQEDINHILDETEKSPHKLIIVTHGTYTMPDTARFLKANLKRKDQTIVLTGSMIPINGFSPSDGPFSLGYALSQVQHLEPALHLCMNGRTFAPEEVSKLVSEGRFVSIFQK